MVHLPVKNAVVAKNKACRITVGSRMMSGMIYISLIHSAEFEFTFSFLLADFRKREKKERIYIFIFRKKNTIPSAAAASICAR
jgi:hypothetical protein